MEKIVSIVLVMVLLASAVPLAVTPVSAISEVYEEKIAGDTDENDELTKDELVSAILPYMLDEGALALDDVGDAAWIYAYWDGKPMTVVDQDDRTVSLYRPVERIVSIYPAATRIILSLDGCNRLVAVSSTTIDRGFTRLSVNAYPEIMKLPSTGSHKTPNAEQVALLKPDVFFSCSTTRGTPIHEKTGIPDVEMRMDCNLASGCFEAYRLAGKVIEKEERAEELVSFNEEKIAELTEVTSQIPENEKPKVHLAFWSKLTRSPGSYYPVDLAGGINVISSDSSVTVSKEQVIDWNPDFILIHGGSKTHRLSIEDILLDPDLQTVNAVKNKSVYYTKGHSIQWDSATGLTEAFYMAKLFHPEKFNDLDMEEKGNEILKKIYGADGLYTWMLETSDLYRWE